jgi:CHAT domain
MEIKRESQSQAFDDIEIRILRDYDGGYVGEINMRDGQASCKLPSLPLDTLNQTSDPRTYGIKLFEWVFQQDLWEVFRRARWSTEMYSRSTNPASSLRLRLWLDPEASDLHRLWWEAMRDPSRDEPLSLETAFSRFVRPSAARGWPISDRPIRLLIIGSNPSGLTQFGLSDIDLKMEDRIFGRATNALDSSLRFNRLMGAPTLSQVREELECGYHIIHVIAHAAITNGSGSLILADAQGRAQPVPFEEVVSVLARSSKEVPYLIFLTTPTMPLTAGEKVGETLVSFAPMLIQAGVQAVVANQAPISNEAMLMLTEKFYNVLIRTGVIDLAVTEARARIYNPNRPDDWQWTHPVLYMRTFDARLFLPLPESLVSNLQIIGGSFAKL